MRNKVNMLPEIKAFAGEEHHAFRLSGGAPAVLLIHGFPGTPDEMRPTAEAFHRSGWTAHALLLPGFGPEINDLAGKTHADWLEAGYKAVETLRNQGHQPIVIAGNSMGGALAIELAAKIKADGLVLFAPFYRVNHILWTLLPVIKIVLPTFKPFKLVKLDFSNPEMREGILRFMPDLDLDDPTTQEAIRDFRIPVSMFNHIRKTGKNAYQLAPDIQCPVLCFQGTRDELVTLENTRAVIQRFQNSVELITLDGEHDLVRRDRPTWMQVEQALKTFAATLSNSD